MAAFVAPMAIHNMPFAEPPQYCRQLTEPGLARMKEMKRLKFLFVEKDKFPDAGFADLKKALASVESYR